MKGNVLILADDLSGAADCAVPFARTGVPTHVFLNPEPAASTESSVCSFDLNTRELTPSQAIHVTSRALKALRTTETTIFYRKVDSTLRGNIGPEILTTSRLLPDRKLVFCAPAFPDVGRTTVQGQVFVNGLPLENSGINPTWSAGKSLFDLFAEVGLRTHALPLELIRSGPATLLRILQNIREPTVLICDAETNDDLSAVAEAGLQLQESSIFVGSAGLTHRIANLLYPQQNVPEPPLVADRPVLVVMGSKSSVSRIQFDHLSSSPGLDFIRVPARALESKTNGPLAEMLARSLSGGQDIAITIELDDATAAEPDSLMVQALGRMLRPFLRKFSALILTGGETARALLSEAEISHLRMIDEIETGVALCSAISNISLPVILKAGAFGKSETLLRALNFLRTQKL
jgi:D-threonate/D-erythronate kinase